MDEPIRLGPPQISFAGLEIRIYGRQFPDRDDFRDGNWVRTTAHCRAPGAAVSASGPIIHRSDIERRRNAVPCRRDPLPEKAALACMEPNLSALNLSALNLSALNLSALNLSALMTADTLAHIAMEVQITPDNLHQDHKVTVDIDRTCLGPLLHQVEAVLTEYPVRGEGPVAR